MSFGTSLHRFGEDVPRSEWPNDLFGLQNDARLFESENFRRFSLSSPLGTLSSSPLPQIIVNLHNKTGTDMNWNGAILEEFVEVMELERLNVTLAEGRVTWNAREHESATDYMLVDGSMRKIV
ncbi:hypothetical protein E2C01_037958 [Portunus trituberculatus]|uniref:Uncharacterized protein n=1 Tax=Portunus trituberculatus TaxID=210409 RepID=A0A5B7FFI0_PORTR|nr:hypothetical protein [Portunus trituberculatus]